MKTVLKLVPVIIIGLMCGCSTMVTDKVVDLDSAPKGVRIYPPKVYLMVDTVEKKTTLTYLPDYQRAYDVKPLAIFSKQDFKIELDEGQRETVSKTGWIPESEIGKI